MHFFVYIAEKIVYNISIIKKEEESSMIKFEFQNPDHNDIWRFIIDFCMSKPEGTPNADLQRMLAEQFGIEASETACALAAIRF